MPAGRPTTYDPAIGQAIVDAIRSDGCSRTAAAESQGIAESTVRAWEDENRDFSRDMKKARGDVKRAAARQLKDSADDGEVAARIFRAKCLDPEQWTERKDHGGIEPASLAEALRELARSSRERDGLEPPK